MPKDIVLHLQVHLPNTKYSSFTRSVNKTVYTRVNKTRVHSHLYADANVCDFHHLLVATVILGFVKCHKITVSKMNDLNKNYSFMRKMDHKTKTSPHKLHQFLF